MRLAIITALHERYRLTRLFLRYWEEVVIGGVDLGLFCAVTTDEYKMREYVLKHHAAWHVSYAENMPLTRKFAANLPAVRTWSPDALMILGSDNFTDIEYITSGIDRLKHADFIGTKAVHYLDMGSDQVIKQWSMDGRPIGAGRIISRELLDYANWNLWEKRDTRLDGSMYERIRWLGIVPDWIDRGTLLDVKARSEDGHSLNQTPFEAVRKSPYEPVSGKEYLNKHFPTIAQDLLAW